MTEVNETHRPKTVFKVVGVGDAGYNALNYLLRNKVPVDELIAVNRPTLHPAMASDTMAPDPCPIEHLALGAVAVTETQEALRGHFTGADLTFVSAEICNDADISLLTAIAETARQAGLLVLGVVAVPGLATGMAATASIMELNEHFDAMILAPEVWPVTAIIQHSDACSPHEYLLQQVILGVTDEVTVQTRENIGYLHAKAELRSIPSLEGLAKIGIGLASGETRAAIAVGKAMEESFLDLDTLTKAQAVYLVMSGSATMTMDEFNVVTRAVHDTINNEASILAKVAIDDDLGEFIKVMIIASGLETSTVF